MNLRDLMHSKDLGDLLITYALLVNTYIFAHDNNNKNNNISQMFLVFKRLGQIFNSDRFKANSSTTQAESAFKLLILACIQNSMLNKQTLQELLNNKDATSINSHMNSDSDLSDTNSDSDDSEVEMDFDEVCFYVVFILFLLKIKVVDYLLIYCFMVEFREYVRD